MASSGVDNFNGFCFFLSFWRKSYSVTFNSVFYFFLQMSHTRNENVIINDLIDILLPVNVFVIFLLSKKMLSNFI